MLGTVLGRRQHDASDPSAPRYIPRAERAQAAHPDNLQKDDRIVISHFFIDRPIFASVLSIVATLAGAVALFALPVAQYPDVTPPTVLVTALYPGANATTVRDTVAAPIEQQVSGVENMIYMSSLCTNDGAYVLTVTFKLGMDSDMAQVLVQNRVQLAEPVIPDLVQREGINVKKMSPSTMMIVNLVSDGRYDNIFLSNYATIQIRDELGRLPGVANVAYLGERDYSMRAWLDPEKLASMSLTAEDVVAAISEQNLQVAAGQIGQPPIPPGQQFQLTINTLGRLIDPEQFADIIIKVGQNQQPAPPAAPGKAAARRPRIEQSQSTSIVRLRDVARIELGSQQYDQSCTLDGKPSVALSIYQLPGSNALQTAKGVYAKMDELKAALPGRPRLPDRLRHHAVHQGIDRRGVQDPARRHHPGRDRGAGVLAKLARCADSLDCRARGRGRHLRGHGGARLLAQ